jgi:two-component system response regulator AtoC
VKLHCAAFPESLLESELFGYEKGAFTGASNRKPGRVELAQGGTLFLDEVGEIALSVQVKLLRLLQDRQIERLGSTHSIDVDVRIVAATHRPLERMTREGSFREDLFYRLAVVPIVVPPLRDRPEDVGPLVEHFLRRFTTEHARPDLRLTADAVQELCTASWPGNVRELSNFVERLVVLTPSSLIGADTVRRELERTRDEAPPAEAAPPSPSEYQMPAAAPRPRRHVTREDVVEALERAGGNRALAARLLGVSRRTLYNKLAEHGLTRSQ